MDHPPHHLDDDYDDHDDPIEGYCVRCREKVEMEHTQAVWTRKGLPATQGECPLCGGTVYRMGRSSAHESQSRPASVVSGQVSPDSGERRRVAQLTRDTVYVSFAPADHAIAQKIAHDLTLAGVAVWVHTPPQADEPVAWAGGIHPALKDCARLLYIASAFASADEDVGAVVAFFREQRRPVVVAQVADHPVPDALRRSPRFDFTQDYRSAFRQMLQALA